MDENSLRSQILLSYKDKVLFMYKMQNPLDEGKHVWSFIGGYKTEEESFESAMRRKVKLETGIEVEDIRCVSKTRYWSQLSDDQVNKMKRSEGQLLSFYTLEEAQKLLLSRSTQKFIDKHNPLT